MSLAWITDKLHELDKLTKKRGFGTPGGPQGLKYASISSNALGLPSPKNPLMKRRISGRQRNDSSNPTSEEDYGGDN